VARDHAGAQERSESRRNARWHRNSSCRGDACGVDGGFHRLVAVALTKTGDAWRLERAITPGLHRLVIRVDGGAWTAPANLPTATDDLGGVVSLVAVP
jgi:hypothetical protein